MNQKKSVGFTADEFNALAFALKARLAIIESKAMAFSGDTPDSFKRCLEKDWEWNALVSVCRKLELND